MRKRHQEDILISYLQEKEKYQRLANFMVRLMVDDPESPRDSLHTLIYRLKDELRLIEKIDILNTKKNRLAKFTTIFQEILASKPFIKSTERSIDIVNALNFALFYELQGKRVAIEGLRGVLRWRKSR